MSQCGVCGGLGHPAKDCATLDRIKLIKLGNVQLKHAWNTVFTAVEADRQLPNHPTAIHYTGPDGRSRGHWLPGFNALLL